MEKPRPLQARRPALPVVRARQRELDTCAYCPRLCRAACPVSNADPREALTPWGKMTSLLQRVAGSQGTLPYACTGCGACTTMCRHDNPVGEVLLEARASLFEVGEASADAQRVAREHPARRERQELALSAIRREVGHVPDAETALLLGCASLRGPTSTALETARAVSVLASGEPLRLVAECCGAIPRMAGDVAGAELARARLVRELDGVRRLLVLDPGCQRQLDDGRLPEVLSVYGYAAARAEGLRSVAEPGQRYGLQIPCWARGSAVEPAIVVLAERLVGRLEPVDAGCSGGGALLPVTHPSASRGMARQRVEDFERAGVTRLIVACAAGARRLRGVAPPDAAAPQVVELPELLWQSVRPR